MVESDLKNFVDDVLGPKLQKIRIDLGKLLSEIFYCDSVLNYNYSQIDELHEKRARLVSARDALTKQILSIFPQYFEGTHWVNHESDPGDNVEIYKQLARQGICADTVNIDEYR